MADSPFDLDELLARIPVTDIAASLGVDDGEAESAIRSALPGLFGGLAVNAHQEDGARSLESALAQHRDKGSFGLDDIDVADGEKIVGHALGADRDGVVAALSGGSGGGLGSQLFQKLLPMLAPIVMSYLADKLFGGRSEPQAAPQEASGGIGDILTQILGGGRDRSSGGNPLDAILGGGGGGLGDILNSILGGR